MNLPHVIWAGLHLVFHDKIKNETEGLVKSKKDVRLLWSIKGHGRRTAASLMY